ncbi:MAG: hypothetical protein ABSE40_24660, partial [Candidatus Sulfotelmatobacter sp.]
QRRQKTCPELSRAAFPLHLAVSISGACRRQNARLAAYRRRGTHAPHDDERGRPRFSQRGGLDLPDRGAYEPVP